MGIKPRVPGTSDWKGKDSIRGHLKNRRKAGGGPKSQLGGKGRLTRTGENNKDERLGNYEKKKKRPDSSKRKRADSAYKAEIEDRGGGYIMEEKRGPS